MILSSLLPMATKLWRVVFLPVVQYDLAMLNCVNPHLSPAHRAWWLHNLLHPTCPRCWPLTTRRFIKSVRGEKLSAMQKKMLKDIAPMVVLAIIVVEHGHGRLRWMSCNGGAATGSSFLSTMSAHQVYFMQTRWHGEALEKRHALALADAPAVGDDLQPKLSEAEGRLRLPAIACFC